LLSCFFWVQRRLFFLIHGKWIRYCSTHTILYICIPLIAKSKRRIEYFTVFYPTTVAQITNHDCDWRCWLWLLNILYHNTYIYDVITPQYCHYKGGMDDFMTNHKISNCIPCTTVAQITNHDCDWRCWLWLLNILYHNTYIMM
jgi:hypothetical protein